MKDKIQKAFEKWTIKALTLDESKFEDFNYKDLNGHHALGFYAGYKAGQKESKKLLRKINKLSCYPEKFKEDPIYLQERLSTIWALIEKEGGI